MKYLLPRNDIEFEDLCELEQFKGTHNTIMNLKEGLFGWRYNKNPKKDSITFSEFMAFVKKNNRKGWRKYC